MTARIQRAEPRPVPPATPRAPEAPAEDGSFGLGIFQGPPKAQPRVQPEAPPARPPAPRPAPPPPADDDGFGTGIL